MHAARSLNSKVSYLILSGLVLLWGGLRGAVSLALALIVELDTGIEASIRDRILFHVAGIVLLTILVNGSTTGLLLKV